MEGYTIAFSQYIEVALSGLSGSAMVIAQEHFAPKGSVISIIRLRSMSFGSGAAKLNGLGPYGGRIGTIIIGCRPTGDIRSGSGLIEIIAVRLTFRHCP